MGKLFKTDYLRDKADRTKTTEILTKRHMEILKLIRKGFQIKSKRLTHRILMVLIALFFVLNISGVAFSTEHPSDDSKEIEPSENIYDGQNEIEISGEDLIIEHDDALNEVSEENLDIEKNDDLNEISEEDLIIEIEDAYVEPEYTEYQYLNE